MSSLLKEAIVDAHALKEAALKNAESAIIAKYSSEVTETIDKLLEQDEMDLELGGPLSGEEMGDPGMGEDPMVATDDGGPVEEVTEPGDIPLAAADGLSKEVGVHLENAPTEGEEIEFNVNLGALQEAIEELKQELDEAEEIEITEEDLVALLEQPQDPGSFAGEEAEEDGGEGSFAGEEAEEDGGEGGPALAGSAAAKASDVEAMKTLGEQPEDSERLPEESLRDWMQRLIGVPMEAGETLVDYLHRTHDAAAEQEAMAQKRAEDPNAPSGWEGVTADDVRGQWDNVDEDISEELIDAVMERLTVDMGATLSGWAGRSSEDIKWELTKALAHRRSTDFEEELEDLKKAHDELVFENNQLKERNTKYEQALTHLQENLQDINLSNARLLYTNRVLRNTSLNERQKEKIVEAISNAGSVTEAKTIHDTLQSTMESKQVKRGPQSLSEAINRRPSVLRATRQESNPADPFSERMKKLAGIK